MKKYSYLLILILATALSCEKANDIRTFYWNETGCADPWRQQADATENELKAEIETYLNTQNIKVRTINFYFDANIAEGCRACFCKTGRIFEVIVRKKDKQKMEGLNFYQ